jgi:hypothetical protein
MQKMLAHALSSSMQQKWRAVLNLLGNVDYNIIMGGISGPKHTHIDRSTKYTQLLLSLSLHSIDEVMQQCEEDDT